MSNDPPFLPPPTHPHTPSSLLMKFPFTIGNSFKMLRLGLIWGVVVLVIVWLYFIPPPPKICGTPGGPPITGPRILLRDGRHLSYQEYGVSKSMSRSNIIYIHSHSTNKKDPFLTTPGFFEEFQVYLVSFDRPGYGESDPHPKRTIRSSTLDIEELADHLEIGIKFYIMGYSSGGALGWGCLKHIPHRLAGVILIAPSVNYWWPRLPTALAEEALSKRDPWMQMNILITHYTPWLTYWWNTQQLFLETKSINHKVAHYFDILLSTSNQTDNLQEYSVQQGLYESYLRDGMVLFGEWEFEPLDLENPFIGTEGSVHVWQGDIDEVVDATLQRYITNNLPWINYHQVSNAGHTFALDVDVKYQIMKTVFKREN